MLAWMEKERHPEFDKYWDEYHKLIYWAAGKLSKNLYTDRENLYGTLTIWFNYTLYHYKPDLGKFSPFFFKGCKKVCLMYWMRRESQSWDNFVAHLTATPKDIQLSEINYATSQVGFTNYHVPEEDEDDIREVIEFFNNVDECWEFMTRALDQMDKEILTLYYRGDMTGQEIGNKFGISKQRVFQRLDRAKESVRRRLKMVSDFAHLFNLEE